MTTTLPRSFCFSLYLPLCLCILRTPDSAFSRPGSPSKAKFTEWEELCAKTHTPAFAFVPLVQQRQRSPTTTPSLQVSAYRHAEITSRRALIKFRTSRPVFLFGRVLGSANLCFWGRPTCAIGAGQPVPTGVGQPVPTCAYHRLTFTGQPVVI